MARAGGAEGEADMPADQVIEAGSGDDEQPEQRSQSSKVAPAATAAAAGTTAPAASSCRAVGAPLLAAAAGAAAAAVYFLVRRLRRQKGGRVKRALVGKHQVFSAVLALREPSAELPPPTAQLLEGRSLVLADRLDAQTVQTRFGSDLWKGSRQAAQQNYGPADVLVAAGARGTAVVHAEPLGLGPLLSISGAGTPNPAGKGRTHGGGDYGAAVSVAAGLADLALAVDELGSARVPAACCGAYALRTTAGVLPLEGASAASHSLAAPALLAADPQLLLKAGQALRLPGGGAPTDVSNYLVAEDFFAACGEEARRMVPAVVAAVKRWAGPDQAQALSLCEWLYHRVASLEAFLPSTDQQQDAAAAAAAAAGGAVAAAAARQQRSEGVLQALAAAAEVIRQWEFAHKYGSWVQVHQQQLPAQVVEFWQQAQQVGEERYRGAQSVAAELQAAMRAALRDGYIFVLPTTPGGAPEEVAAAGSSAGGASSSSSPAAAAFRQRCLQFAAVASLAGVPQVVLPLPVPGGMPLSVSLLAAHKRDLALLQAAAKLGPMLAEEAAVLAGQHEKQGRAGDSGSEQQGWRPRAAAAEDAQAAGGSGGGSKPAARKNGAGGRKQDEVSAQLAAAAAAAEARKEDGNAAFRAGRYEDAARQYSAAIQLHPKGAGPYYSNRAMAYLKLGSYGAAEADCDEALKLELSAKALLRRGSARLAQGNADGAKADFRQVVALEPQNRQAREELRGIEAMEEQLQPGAF